MYDMISGEFRQPIIQLVGGLEHFLFSHILGIIIPTDYTDYYFSEGLKPPTRQ